MKISDKARFKNAVLIYYQAHGRHNLPWRRPEKDGSFDGYKILVSEIMLQQTQVARVVPKYTEFIDRFPSPDALAQASLGEVLTLWSGLGYNRRAKYLHQAAQMIVQQGEFPASLQQLTALPGVGSNTAGAIMAYTFNQPVLFIETNIRSVYIHHFFQDTATVTDQEILKLLQATIDQTRPRLWYWALMDYGSFIKQTVGNPNHLSATYGRQSIFKGSRRQVRGQIIRLLATGPKSPADLETAIKDIRLQDVLADLVAEKLIRQTTFGYEL